LTNEFRRFYYLTFEASPYTNFSSIVSGKVTFSLQYLSPWGQRSSQKHLKNSSMAKNTVSKELAFHKGLCYYI